MTQSKPAKKGALKGNSKKSASKNVYVDKYKDKAQQSWDDTRRKLVSSLPANTGLPIADQKKSAKKRLTSQQKPDDVLL